MRRILPIFTSFAVLLALTLSGRAGDETTAIVDKAIAAHGLKGKEGKENGFRSKNKGTIHVAGMDIDFTQEVAVQTPDKFRESLEMSIMGNKIPITTVFNGKEGWIKVADQDIKVENELLDEFKDIAYSMTLAQGLFLKDKGIKLALLGEVQVKGKPAVGIRVSKEGRKEISFYFDKETGLMSKMERRGRDFQTMQEVTEERIITEYQDVGGRKVAKKAEMLRDGKPFLEAEVSEVEILDRIPDAEFAKP